MRRAPGSEKTRSSLDLPAFLRPAFHGARALALWRLRDKPDDVCPNVVHLRVRSRIRTILPDRRQIRPDPPSSLLSTALSSDAALKCQCSDRRNRSGEHEERRPRWNEKRRKRAMVRSRCDDPHRSKVILQGLRLGLLFCRGRETGRDKVEKTMSERKTKNDV